MEIVEYLRVTNYLLLTTPKALNIKVLLYITKKYKIL